MIDIHCHIIPGVDDGAENMDESIKMAKAAARQGIRTLIATPHHQNGAHCNERAEIITALNQLNERIAKEEIPLKILPGQEIRMYGEIINDIDNNKILPLNNTQYMLIELPFGYVPNYTEHLLYQIQLKGYTPIIAHPERNRQLVEDPDILYELVCKGVVTQVTAGSLLGHYGKKAETFSKQLLEANLTHFIASDAHNTDRRPFTLEAAYAKIEKQFGIDWVYLLKENSELLIQDKNVYREPPEKIRRRKILGIF